MGSKSSAFYQTWVAIAALFHVASVIAAADGQTSRDAEAAVLLDPPRVRDRGAALYYRASIKLHAGATREALELLEQCLELHEGFDPSGSPAFKVAISRSDEWTKRIAEWHTKCHWLAANCRFSTVERRRAGDAHDRS